MIAGNGALNRKIATNAAAATATITPFLSALRLILRPASMTMASTAAFTPKKMPSTSGTWRQVT